MISTKFGILFFIDGNAKQKIVGGLIAGKSAEYTVFFVFELRE
nr:hypothetical protein [Pedobacter panaciterrae]